MFRHSLLEKPEFYDILISATTLMNSDNEA